MYFCYENVTENIFELCDNACRTKCKDAGVFENDFYNIFITENRYYPFILRCSYVLE